MRTRGSSRSALASPRAVVDGTNASPIDAIRPEDARAGRRDVRDAAMHTVRKGDTLESIASKRSMRVEDVKKYNKSLGGEEALAPGTTDLFPSEKLSKRDQQIIDGIKG